MSTVNVTMVSATITDNDLIVLSTSPSSSAVAANVSVTAAVTADLTSLVSSSMSGNAMDLVYFWLTAVTSVLSVVGASVLIVADVAFRDLRTSGRRLLSWLSISDCLTAVGNFIGVFW